MVKRKKLIIASAVVGSIVLATIIGFAVKSCCCSKGSSKSPKSEDSSPINFENNAGTLDEEIFGEGESGFCPKRVRPSDSDHVENSDVPQSESKGILKDVVFGKDGVKKVLVIDNPEEYIEKILSCAEMPNPLLDGGYLKTLKYFKSPRLDESFTIENCSLLIACLALRKAEIYEDNVLADRIFKNLIDLKQVAYRDSAVSYKQLMIRQNPLSAELFKRLTTDQVSSALAEVFNPKISATMNVAGIPKDLEFSDIDPNIDEKLETSIKSVFCCFCCLFSFFRPIISI